MLVAESRIGDHEGAAFKVNRQQNIFKNLNLKIFKKNYLSVLLFTVVKRGRSYINTIISKIQVLNSGTGFEPMIAIRKRRKWNWIRHIYLPYEAQLERHNVIWKRSVIDEAKNWRQRIDGRSTCFGLKPVSDCGCPMLRKRVVSFGQRYKYRSGTLPIADQTIADLILQLVQCCGGTI